MNYYRRYVGDYLKDTSRLSMLEHGAYGLLLDYYYAEERPIPLDLDEVFRMVRAIAPAERRAIEKVLSAYFERRADGYHNARADEEIAVLSSESVSTVVSSYSVPSRCSAFVPTLA